MAAAEQRGQQPRALQLTDVEAQLRRLLLDVASYINKDKPSELRYTGGWVRDKLLGVDSHDIDVAINDMTGYQFGLRLKEYLELPGNAEKYGLQGPSSASSAVADKRTLVHELHKIEANPEKSKHLETVTTKILGLDVDLVNLRKEVYDELSRNPQMEFGGPKEDADRRDATINAMFYNLQTQLVEDFTGRGLQDLESKIIMTPLEPLQTFKDDPLRILRLIRFSSRLNFAIDQSALENMKDPSVLHSLKVKISRERIGVELEKMLKGPGPHKALSIIDQLGLYTTIFSDPTSAQTYEPETSSWRTYLDILQGLLNTETAARTLLLPDEQSKYLAWILACLVPYNDAPEPKAVKAGGKVAPPLATSVAREGIKATNKVCDVVSASIEHRDEITNAKSAFIQAKRSGHKSQDGSDPLARDVLGRAIRRWGASWRSQAVFAFLIDSGNAASSGRDATSEWSSFLSHISDQDLLEAYDLKPIIDGNMLAKALNTRPGPWMKGALDVVMAWQLRHPDSATPDGAIEAVKEHQKEDTIGGDSSQTHHVKGELTAELIHHFLQLTIRPLFSKTQVNHSDTITAQGRKKKVPAVAPRKHENLEDERVTRPWKSPKNSDSLSILTWCIGHLTPSTTEKEWPILIPPLLTLLDDMETRYRALGATLLTRLIKTTPPSFLKRTGLGDVFASALSPSLHHLPTLTPEAESITMLSTAYPAMFGLTAIQNPSPKLRKEALMRILHENLLPSLTHISPGPGISSPYPQLTRTLLVYLQSLVQELGIDTISHLVHIYPALDSIFSDPFILLTKDGALLVAEATKSLSTVLANSWPRAHRWRGQVLDMLTASWVRAHEADEEMSQQTMKTKDGYAKEDLEAVNHELQKCAKLLVKCCDAVPGDENDQIDIRDDLRQCLAADERLEGLFGKLVSSGPKSE